jgi:hypothetical protein
VQEEEDDNPTEKRRHFNTDLQRWQLDNHDTATWLYHAVFSVDPAPSTTANRRIPLEARSATVEEYNSDTSEPAKDGVVDTGTNDERDNELIVWNKATEPSIVVDRLLSAWTFLQPTQIQASREYYASGRDENEETRTNDLVRDLQEFEKRKLKGNGVDVDPTDPFLDFSDVSSEPESVSLTRESEYSSDDDAYVSAEESTINGDPPNPPPIQRAWNDEESKRVRYNFGTKKPHNNGRQPWQPKQKSRVTQPIQKKKRQPAAPYSGPYVPKLSYPNPFAPETYPQYMPPNGNPFGPGIHPSFGSAAYHEPSTFVVPQGPPTAFPPRSSAPPPPPLHKFYNQENGDTAAHPSAEGLVGADQTASRATAATETSSRLERLETLLTQELIHSRKSDYDEEHQNMVSQSSKEHDEKLERLEKLLLDQGEEQLRRQAEIEAAWKVEKLEREARYAKDALEAKKLAEQEISAAKSAKKAAEKALKFAKKQVEERVRKEAEYSVAEERRKVKQEYEKRMNKYEEQLAAYTRHWQETDDVLNGTPTPNPLRTTYISEGQRRIEISEFTKERLEPLLLSQVPSAGFFDRRRADEHASTLQSARRSLPGRAHRYGLGDYTGFEIPQSPASHYSSRPSDVQYKSAQQVLLLPSHLERTSPMATGMQNTLQACGVLTAFDDPDYNESEALIGSHSSLDQVVHSTVFWEPPVLSLGSELLNTLRRRGWQAFYVRKSSKSPMLPILCTLSCQLTSCRSWSYLLPRPSSYSRALLPTRVPTTA